MSQCAKCGHEHEHDVTNYVTHFQDRQKPLDWYVDSHWYCKKCKQSWHDIRPHRKDGILVDDQATSFNFGPAARS